MILNALIPIYCIVVQLANLIFTLMYILRIDELLSKFGKNRTPVFFIDFIDLFTPSFLLLVFTIFTFTNFIFLLRWRKKVHEYEEHYQDPDVDKGKVTLTQLFYDIINIMEKLRIIFYGLNVMFVFYLQWFFRFFLNELPRVILRPVKPSLLLSNIMPWLNLSLLLLLLIYLAYNWRHFLKWNKKLIKLKDFEKQIYQELDLDGKGILLVYGDLEDLEKAQDLLEEKKEISVKYLQLEDKNQFESKLNELVGENED
ncbi:MAG: hypothetical protein ACXAC8_13010 [Candidatus Hodarchaeales archaeon]